MNMAASASGNNGPLRLKNGTASSRGIERHPTGRRGSDCDGVFDLDLTETLRRLPFAGDDLSDALGTAVGVARITFPLIPSPAARWRVSGLRQRRNEAPEMDSGGQVVRLVGGCYDRRRVIV